MRARIEPWGAWVKLREPPALVALDREGTRALGLDGGASWSDEEPAPPSPPVEVHLAVTARCAAGCRGCYLDARPEGQHVPALELMRALDAMAATGVFTVAMGGGEPSTRDDLGELADAARARGISPVVTTSGLGMNEAKLAALSRFDQVNVSYDGAGASYSAVRGFDGAGPAERAIAALGARGVRVGVNVVLTRDTYAAIEATLARAFDLGACEAQLLRYKPAGRAASLDYLAARLTPEQATSLGPTLRRLSARFAPRCGLRIDCALVPFLSADPELATRPEALAAFGVFGCEGGQALLAVRSDGRVAPCSFAAPTGMRMDALGAHADDPELARWRAYAGAPAEPCASCTLRTICKGGCKVVTQHLEGAHGPDPECPRVRGSRGA